MALLIILITSSLWFVLFWSGIPAYIALLSVQSFIITHNLTKLILSAVMCLLILAKVSFGPSVYIEYTDTFLWIFTIFFFYVFTQMKVSQKKLYIAIIGLSLFHISSGFFDVLLAHATQQKLISLVPNIVEIRTDFLFDINIGVFGTFRMQGFFSEPSYFSIVSVSLYVIIRKFYGSKKWLGYLLLATIIWAYSISGFILLFLFWSSSIFFFLKKHLIRSVSLVTLMVAIIYFEQNLWNQFIMKITGEHISGAARLLKLISGFDVFMERPFFGYQPGYFISISGTQPGNVYLTLMIEFGLIGLIVFTIYVLYIFRRVFNKTNFNILVIQFSLLAFMNVSYNPIFYLPLIFCFHTSKLNANR